MIGGQLEDDKLEPIGPPSLLPQEKLRRKAETIKVSCCQGISLFVALSMIFLVVMCASIYVGFWINLHDEDEFGLIVTAGDTEDQSSPETLLLPLHIDTSPCQKPPPGHPISPLLGAVGAVMGKRLRVCGGSKKIAMEDGTSRNESLAECRTLDRGKWVIKHEGDSGLFRMTTGRAFSAATVVPEVGWWVTGGVDSNNGLLRTTEIAESVSVNPKFEGGPLLPENVAMHCLVLMTASKVMLIGGRTERSDYSSETWLYDWQDRKDRWKGRARMGHGRHSHACFEYREKVVVAGGAISGWSEEGSDSAEIYDKEEDSWRAIAALPHRFKGGFSFSLGSKPTIAGGSDEVTLIKYHEDDGWSLRNDKKLASRAGSYAVAVTTKMTWVCE